MSLWIGPSLNLRKMSDPDPWDLVVIGGGAAGFFAAIVCAEAASGSRVLIVEKASRALGKVKISGGGRCNVTHSCFDAKALTEHYPRGSKSLIGPFHRWGVQDTVKWFQDHGVELKTEVDGRMFPTTDSSQTIIDCLENAARRAGVVIQTSTSVDSIAVVSDRAHDPMGSSGFILETNAGNTIKTRNLLLATGGTRLAAGARLAESLGHELTPNVPSLFAFNIEDERIAALQGVSVPNALVTIDALKLKASGPLLITHHGLSGPGILKLSAWGARELHAVDYKFTTTINWLPEADVAASLQKTRKLSGKRMVCNRSPFTGLPKRLWQRLCMAACIPQDCTWSHLGKKHADQLVEQITACRFHVFGKSMNKDEFVTCGGVILDDVHLKTMESKITPGLYFAGEVLNVDGITGGFNFQNAWTTGYLAGSSIAAKS